MIYEPIGSIERALHNILEGRTDINFRTKKGSRLYSLSASMRMLVNRLSDLINREYSATLLKKQAELSALQSQINPHFLYNTLESIRGQALCEGVRNIAQMAKALSNLFKYSISRESSMVSLEEELKNVDNYIIIQQYRFNNKFKIIKEIDKDTFAYKIPKLSIQPIIENAIHHGLETKMGAGTIKIKIYCTEKKLIITVEDDGIGMCPERLMQIQSNLQETRDSIIKENESDGPRIGLINVNERIRLIFGEDYGVRISSTLGLGTVVELVLPLRGKNMTGENG